MGYDLLWAERELSEWTEEDPAYFRLTNIGMLRAATLLAHFEMLDPEEDWAAEVPSATISSEEKVDAARGEDDEDDDWAEEWDPASEDLDADDGDLIPLYKLSSNAGWLVTRGEIEGSLAAYDQRYPDPDHQPRAYPVPGDQDAGEEDIVIVDWWGEWIDWLRGAVRHGGFRVY